MKRIAPTILTVHDSTPFQGAATSHIQQIMAETGPQIVDEVIVHTAETKSQLVKAGISPTAISIIPHGVIRYPTTDGWPTDTPKETTLLFFGNVKPYKGVDVLIDAIARLPPEIRRTSHLVVAGRPHGNINDLKSMARERGVSDLVSWELGFVEHERVSEYFQRSDVVVFPYRHIDQSGALMTALPFGKPVVATEVGGFDDVLTDGVHGRLVPPDDADALANALTDVLRDKDRRVAMGNAVAELAHNTYSWERIAEMTTDLYQEALRDR